MAAQPTLATARLTLRPLAADDARRIAMLAGDPDVARMTTSIPPALSCAQAADFIARMAAGDPAREQVFAVAQPSEGLVGLVGFHPNELGAPEIGCWFGRPFWGRGYASESVAAALRWAAGAWGRRFVLSGHFADNAASARVLIKAGFLYTGEVRRRYSLARDAVAPTRMMVWLP